MRGVRDNAPYHVVFDENGTPHRAKHINAYLTDAADVFVESRRKPIVTDAAELVFGSMPNDGGNLSDWNTERKNAVVEKYPAAAVGCAVTGQRLAIALPGRMKAMKNSASPHAAFMV